MFLPAKGNPLLESPQYVSKYDGFIEVPHFEVFSVENINLESITFMNVKIIVNQFKLLLQRGTCKLY